MSQLSYNDVEAYLASRFTDGFKKLCDLPSPTLLKDGVKASRRIAKAVENREQIVPYDDKGGVFHYVHHRRKNDVAGTSLLLRRVILFQITGIFCLFRFFHRSTCSVRFCLQAFLQVHLPLRASSFNSFHDEHI